MRTDLWRSRWFQGFAAAALVALISGACAAQPLGQAPAAAPIAPGQARVWFYRVYFPEDTGGMPAVSLNGNIVGYARAGWSFYRDVPAGTYRVSVASVGNDGDQSKNITLAAGAQAYLAIESDPTWMSDRPGFRQPTYAIGVEPAQAVAIHLSQMQFGNGE
jgi:hypothetical protein